MSKKTLTIIISAILTILLLCIAGYYFIVSRNGGNAGDVIDTFRSFLPFGGNESSQPTTNNDDGGAPTTPSNQNQGDQNFVKRLRKISAEPVSGAGTLDIKAGTVLRYIEKATGHIYEVELFSPKKQRVSNTTLPLPYDAVWGNKNDSLIARYLKDDDVTVDTYSLTINNKSTTTENVTTGVVFPESVSDVSVYNNLVFYLTKNSNSSFGFVSDFSGKNVKRIWNSDIVELNSQFINEKNVTLNTKPANNVPGFLYLINTASGSVKKIMGNIAGLTSNTNSDASQVLYLEQSGVVNMYIYNTKTNTSTKITPNTMPEKCVWSNKNSNIVYCAIPKEFISATSQDMWYKGLLSFTDDIWVFDTKNSSSGTLLDLENESGEKIDAFKPILSENDQYLIFMNKKDNSLWSLDLSKTSTTTSEVLN